VLVPRPGSDGVGRVRGTAAIAGRFRMYMETPGFRLRPPRGTRLLIVKLLSSICSYVLIVSIHAWWCAFQIIYPSGTLIR